MCISYLDNSFLCRYPDSVFYSRRTQDERYIKTSSPVVVKFEDPIVIEVSIPVSQIIESSRRDIVNKAANKSMEDLCKDVADMLKSEFGFRLLREVQDYIDPETHCRAITEGHPSSNEDSLSLYYCVRYNPALSDSFATDNFEFSSMDVVAEFNMVIRITTHPFTASGVSDTREFNRSQMKKLDEQEDSEPYGKFDDQQEVAITELVKSDYESGLQEIHDSIVEFIKDLRIKIYYRIK